MSFSNLYWLISTFPRITPVINPLRYTYYQYRTNSISTIALVFSVYSIGCLVWFIGHALRQCSTNCLQLPTPPDQNLGATRPSSRVQAVVTVPHPRSKLSSYQRHRIQQNLVRLAVVKTVPMEY